MSTLKEDITQQASKGSRFFEVICFSPRFMSCLPMNLIGYLLKLMAAAADWKTWLKFCVSCLWLFFLALPFTVACWWSPELNEWRNLFQIEHDFPLRPSQNGKILPMIKHLLFPTHHYSGLLKAYFHAHPWELRAEAPQTHSLCSNLDHPHICCLPRPSFSTFSLPQVNHL